jgi:4'-phosphopantetheinyl transferase
VGEHARLLSVQFDPAEINRWTLYSLDPGPGYAGALAVEGKNHVLKYWDWKAS